MIKKIVFGLVALFLGAALIYGCGQTTSSSGGGTVSPTSQTFGNVMGTVTDEAGSALGSVKVTVTSSNQATAVSGSTNDQGWFSLSNVMPNGKVLVTFSLTGKVPVQKVIGVQARQSTFVDVTMVAASPNQSLNLSNGGTLTGTSGTGLSATVMFSTNTALVDAGGNPYTSSTANVSVTPFDLTNSTNFNAFPGQFSGQRLDSSVVDFASYGFVNVSVTDASGNPLNLAAGTATVTMAVPAALQGTAPSPIPMWYYNATTGTWIEDGTATYNAATQSYVGTVTHFSTWNFDIPYSQRANVIGKVVDSSGIPIAGAQIYIKGLNWASGDTGTLADGKFNDRVKAGDAFTIYAQKGNKKSTVVSVAAGLTSTTTPYDVGNLVIANSAVFQVTLTWEANPRDLDSHLTIPASIEGGTIRYHLYYGNRGSTPTTRWPNANLDTDDTSSYGPEVTTVNKLYAGVYRFCVHHYSGTGTISTSPTRVELLVNSGPVAGIYDFDSPAGAPLAANGTDGTGDIWRVFDLTVDSSGTITNIATIGNFQASVSAADNADDGTYSPQGSGTAVMSASGIHPTAFEILKK